jgi:hypothetical protein
VTLASLIFYFGFPFFAAHFLITKFDHLPSDSYLADFGSLYLTQKTAKRPQTLYIVFFLLRRLIFALSATLLSDWPLIQVNLLFLQSLSLLWYFLHYRPFKEPLTMFQEVFNETCILVVTYPCLMFTGFFDTSVELAYKTGWLVIGAIGFNIVVNLTIAFYISFKGLCLLAKKGIAWYRIKIN